ncbi:MAG TPA: hypothetical protein P5270_07250 [Victivallales bacterium]|nr:hypothetical protein [Victivallales bacterium]HPO91215.1 hypothetical protein [Victivallales bacterium]HRR29145.1 hypothetical protein [Victivallales bacterium]
MNCNKIDEEILYIVTTLQKASYETYIVGGAVRDMLLNIPPKDYDISTSATPEEIKTIFKRRTRIIGHRFKLIHYYAKNRRIVEISTFRREPPETQKFIEIKGRLRPNDNCYGTSYEDAWRRDFTVNAIFYDPINNKFLDFTGMGRNDLERKILRTIGEPTLKFAEDPVRILRALKLIGIYDFFPEEQTEKAFLELMPLIRNTSISRLSLEFEKILKNQNTGKILKTFLDYGFLEYFLPNLNSEFMQNPEKKEILFALFEEWNKRISTGRFRISMSIALSLLIAPFLPFIVNLNDAMKFEEKRREIDVSIFIKKLIYPHIFPKRLLAISIEILFLQSALLNCRKNHRIMKHPHFHHALEFVEILNSVIWKNNDLSLKLSMGKSLQ